MKLIALGDNSADVYCNTGEVFPGGNAVNVAVHAARQGAQAEYLGAFGDDAMARVIRKALTDNRVDIRHSPILPGKTTKLCRYNIIQGERSFLDVVTGDTWAGPLQLQPEDFSVLAQADLIVSSCNAKMPEQMRSVEQLPPVFAFDFGEKEKYRTAAYYDQVCCGIDLAMLSCNAMTVQEFSALCAPLHARGTVHILATMGSAGQMLSVQGQVLQASAEKILPADTMGAGDCFLAAFLCSLAQDGWQKHKAMPEEALHRALLAGQQAAAQNCLVQGGFGCKVTERNLFANGTQCPFPG